MTEDIVSFLRARLDEDEAPTREAWTDRRWVAITDGSSGPEVRVGAGGDIDDHSPEWSRAVNYQMWHCDDEQDGCPEVARGWIAEAEHIAHWDPARVLREVEAKRLIIALHVGDHDCVIMVRGTYPSDWPAGGAFGAPGQPWSHPSVEHHEGGPCETLRLLALPYADHPSYRQEWAP